jgi:hypothetical protein
MRCGKYSACRRVARTIYLGSAPTAKAANRGLEDRRIKLGCVMPGESPAIFGDTLRRLSAAATYLYQAAAGTRPDTPLAGRPCCNQAACGGFRPLSVPPQAKGTGSFA